jgi:hypothetical protein
MEIKTRFHVGSSENQESDAIETKPRLKKKKKKKNFQKKKQGKATHCEGFLGRARTPSARCCWRIRMRSRSSGDNAIGLVIDRMSLRHATWTTMSLTRS